MSLERALSIDPDLSHRPAVAMKVDTSDSRSEVPMHSHRKGQLIIALRGGVTCEVPGALLMVPPQCAIWLPGGTPHSNRATANAHIWFLFVEPGCADLPDECCTLSITPLLREGIRHLAELPWDYEPGSATDHLVRFLLAELARMPASGTCCRSRTTRASASSPPPWPTTRPIAAPWRNGPRAWP